MALSTIKTASIANDAVTTDKIVNDGNLGNRNLIINGAMQVAQRGTSETGITAGKYANAPDRFQLGLASAGTWTAAQSTDAPDGFSNSYRLDCTTADASLSGGDLLVFQQAIEGQNLQHLKKGTSSAESVTVSFYVKSNKTGTYIAELFDADNGRQISQAYTISFANTWEKKTLTYAGDTSGALNNDNAVSLYLVCWLAAGSSYSSGSLSTSWTANTQANRAVGQVNLADSTDNNWSITGVQLEIGEQGTPFEHRSFADELQRCRRYFQVHDDMQLRGNPDGAFERIEIYCPLGVPMRANPSKSITTAGNSSNIRSPATTYAGFLILRKEGCVLALESNSAGLAHFDNRTETLDAEL